MNKWHTALAEQFKHPLEEALHLLGRERYTFDDTKARCPISHHIFAVERQSPSTRHRGF